MLFNSLHFAIFFPVVAAAYFALPYRVRWAFLLAASYYFYMAWEPGYVLLIWISTLVDYIVALRIGCTPDIRRRRGWLYFSLAVNIGLLFFFKYYNFFADTLQFATASLGFPGGLPHSPFLLPVGISFYTFQKLSYTLEVYWGRQIPERHLGRFALYVAFFPQLVAGPIERPGNLLPQFLEKHDFDYERVTGGLKLMVWGLFQKAVIADRLAQVVDYVYADPSRHGGPALAVATVFFAFQILCDFSGYTDIAIGAAQVLGFRLMANFRRPYFASSTADFWRRWHISLSSWFRDYLYIPLGGNRVTLPRWIINIVLVFLLCGFWHGARWTFVGWGLLHASYLVLGRVLKPLRARLAAVTGLEKTPRLLRSIRLVPTFLLVCFAWILFRAETFGQARVVISNLALGWRQTLDPAFYGGLGVLPRELGLCAALIGLLLGIHALQSRGGLREGLARRPFWFRWVVYSAALWGIFLFGVLRQKEFIYFVF